MRKVSIYIDESGTLPDPADRVVVVVAIGTESVVKIDEILKRVKKKASLKKPGGEIKYYTDGNKTKFLFDEEAFNKIIRTLVGKEIPIEHVDSKNDNLVNVADMVAGAVLAKEAGKDTRFYKVIENKITSSKRVNWREVKKRLLTTKKLA